MFQFWSWTYNWMSGAGLVHTAWLFSPRCTPNKTSSLIAHVLYLEYAYFQVVLISEIGITKLSTTVGDVRKTQVEDARNRNIIVSTEHLLKLRVPMTADSIVRWDNRVRSEMIGWIWHELAAASGSKPM